MSNLVKIRVIKNLTRLIYFGLVKEKRSYQYPPTLPLKLVLF